MPNNQFDINVNNGVAIVVDNDVRSVKWMEVYPSLFNQSKSLLQREKEGDLTQSYNKTPYTNRKFENQRTTHTNATKNFDYTTIADRHANIECLFCTWWRYTK